MTTYSKVLVILILLIIAILLTVNLLIYSGPSSEETTAFTEQIYKENKAYLYEIIDFFNTSEIIHITTDDFDVSLYKKVKDCYVYTGSNEDLTKEQEDTITDIAAFMTENKIEGILKYNNAENNYLSFTFRFGKNAVILTYCPQNQDINEIMDANYSKSWYIDDSWYIVDPQHENCT